ncbi:TPA: helix-turn-helix domain-containing protein [Pseudomonas aeruginosa]|uniref:AraC family transcriptional regulator n=1 Tax=Pseudomonas aeruginosa TaxID=287 RepID=UPI000AC5C374|nr:AraC family transcriptional regulator [Pseudomonas aeruginosa]EKX2037777.1 helix-turn-helix domain-containing protein [Pseudomonas aeruginosa]MBG4883722.1 helix-turn-helix domain-containing protein [Pseudomonas aeruginosa]MBG5586792.1 helix-turn-helix domain-containing protein [Pseudomonas aeruginosa]MBI8145136.1 helix-turn-helix domain-containing protein [Pseudomonas aeruginosa]MCB5957194.1 AraC family transcriptional regulator [Pseudomonas aeruginosa]
MSPSENIQYDFEWRPLNNYLAVQRITPPDMRQGSAAEPRLPSEALYEWIVLNGRSPLEGLSLGEHYRLSDYGVAGLALQSAGTVGEALQLIKTNMLLFRKDIRGIAVRRSSCDTVDVDIDLQDKPDWPQSARLYHANVLASAAYAVFRDLLLGELELVRLRLPERNGDVRAYEEYFRVPVYFAGAGITFTLPEELLEAEIATANSAVFQASLALGSKAFNTRVTREMGGYRQRIVALLEVLQDRYPSIAWVARQLKVTERTLRRRLADEGTNYREVLDLVRHDRARQLLRDERLRIEEVAERLGYMDTSSFRHAFRRWTGQCANDYRQTRLAGKTARRQGER